MTSGGWVERMGGGGGWGGVIGAGGARRHHAGALLAPCPLLPQFMQTCRPRSHSGGLPLVGREQPSLRLKRQQPNCLWGPGLGAHVAWRVCQRAGVCRRTRLSLSLPLGRWGAAVALAVLAAFALRGGALAAELGAPAGGKRHEVQDHGVVRRCLGEIVEEARARRVGFAA